MASGGLKTFLSHPSFLLLSTFTFFSFRSNSKKYCAKHCSSQMDTELCFSLRATLFNIAFSFLGMFFYSSLEPSRFSLSVNSMRDLPGALTLGSFVLGVLFTLIFLATSFSSNYTLSSCGSCSPALEFGVYRPSCPRKAFVLEQNKQDRRRIVVEVKEGEDEERVITHLWEAQKQVVSSLTVFSKGLPCKEYWCQKKLSIPIICS